jgi:signal transduction histidine kinase
VCDEGRGIPEADLPHLFTRFYQVRRTDVGAPAGGLGLGLHITRELVMAQGGSIEVASHLGSGTTFTLRFPLVDGHEAQITPP